ncbi:hypothetical protein PINS_up014584 [Pythium insidiosum]|nr:hypothetical protein PINS_up014584 [Pythium insidiosum]
MVPPSSPPTDEQRKSMCAEPACHTLIEKVLAKNPSDCVLLGILNVKKLADDFKPFCEKNKPTSAPTTGPTPGPTPGPTSSPTNGPTTAPTSGPTNSPTTAPTTRPAC